MRELLARRFGALVGKRRRSDWRPWLAHRLMRANFRPRDPRTMRSRSTAFRESNEAIEPTISSRPGPVGA
jgi:hypothetical protein